MSNPFMAALGGGQGPMGNFAQMVQQFNQFKIACGLLHGLVLLHIRIDPFADQFIRGRAVGFRRSLKGFRDLPF